jgi:4-hydroxy-3-polyprenylbenzoate decarboxylase
MTAIGDRAARRRPGGAVRKPAGYKIPCLTNLFGTPERVALGMGAESVDDLRDVGRCSPALKEPEPPRGLKDAGKLLQMAKAVWDMKPAVRARALPGGGAGGQRGRPGRCRCRPAGRATPGR